MQTGYLVSISYYDHLLSHVHTNVTTTDRLLGSQATSVCSAHPRSCLHLHSFVYFRCWH